MEEYVCDTQKSAAGHKVFVLVIYDIVDNRKRNKLSKLLSGFGFRVQKSAFEAEISSAKYEKLLNVLKPFGTDEDSVRVYKIHGTGQVTTFGKTEEIKQEEIIVI